MRDRHILLFKLITFISAGAGGITASFLNLHLEQVVGYIGDKTGQYAIGISDLQ